MAKTWSYQSVPFFEDAEGPLTVRHFMGKFIIMYKITAEREG